MFKKLKDKLAEEVKSSPQRIQQFAQAAQAAVTSASSSISDITNNDLFSIGDNENHQNRSNKAQTLSNTQHNAFTEVSLAQPSSLQTSIEDMNNTSSRDNIESQHHRRLSNSSFTSDMSFRLPSYESPSMYHLQSDIEVSASEAEERGFSASTVSLDRVTKEQLYAAYKRTQERYAKYRTQYADLARHYKILERENAKARSVLVETQDKALRRISELREQCSLEQSAKAHLEKALRDEIEERNMKIDSLNTKIQLLSSNTEVLNEEYKSVNLNKIVNKNESQLIDLSNDIEMKQTNDESSTQEIRTLNNKIEKMEQLLKKYKESFKVTKEKNTQMTTELEILSSELDNKNKEIEQLNACNTQLTEAKQQIQELKHMNEELQNKVNVYEFNESKEMSTLEIDLQKAQEEITELLRKIEVFNKREEEYAISLAENKLSIHKELESKEAEIKTLKDNLSAAKKEIQSLNIVINDYKNSISSLEEERFKLISDVNELNSTKTKIKEMDSYIQELTHKCQSLESLKTKADEEYKCLQLQMNQETAEKLAMIDRNVYLENRNTQLSQENEKKTLLMNNLENELQKLKQELPTLEENLFERSKMLQEINAWKCKFNNLESEMQEEREELVKLQSEIEKLIANHELIQIQNAELRVNISELKAENEKLKQASIDDKIKIKYEELATKVKDLRKTIILIFKETIILKESTNFMMCAFKEKIILLLNKISSGDVESIKVVYEELKKDYSSSQNDLREITEQYEEMSNQLNTLQKQNEHLKFKIEENESENGLLSKKIEKISEQYEIKLGELNATKSENENLRTKLAESDNKNEVLQTTIKHDSDQHLVVADKVISLEREKRELSEKIKDIEDNNTSLNMDLDKIRNQYESTLLELEVLTNERDELRTKMNDYEDNLTYTHNLKENVNILEHENVVMSNRYKNLESKLNAIQKSYENIKIENNRLNLILKKVESQEHDNKKVTNDVDAQTDNNDITEQKQSLSILGAQDMLKEVEQLKEINVQLSNNLLQQSLKNEELQMHNEMTNSENYNTLLNERDLLKEENRRLQSDIEGLQSYLTKISKENSLLNDKLRELIASSENTPDKNDLTQNHDLANLEKEIQTGKEKMEDLLRENTLLIEENLELKDQLHTQNYIKSNDTITTTFTNDKEKESEIVTLNKKYNDVLDTKNKLEKKVTDLERINKSVNVNVQQMQESNDKLRLSNEKLERRLDEALVSLRHLHSLQENTELEYLRNILYEYLTGSGTHSITLAKVLSAVVKFDETQTQQVLQRERERQGLLRQLGFM